MAIACVQKTNQSSCTGVGAPISGVAVASITVTLPANVTSGNAIVVGVSTGSTVTLSFGTGMGVTSANWAQAKNQIMTGGNETFIWYGLNSTGASLSVVVTPSSSADIAGEAVEFSGVATSGALDTTGGETGATTSVTTTSLGINGELYFASEVDDCANAPSAGPTNSFTTAGNYANGTNAPLFTAYKIIAGADSTGWTLTCGSVNWGTAGATFKVSGGAAAAPSHGRIPELNPLGWNL